MKITEIVPYIHTESSGPAYAVVRLAQSLAGLGHESKLLCLAPGREVAGVDVEICMRISDARRGAISPTFPFALHRNVATQDVVHNHSLWSFTNLAFSTAALRRGALLVTSPHGTLSAWALRHSGGKKRLLWNLQKPALSHAGLLHATSEAEAGDIRRVGLRAPIAIVPNGIDLSVHPRPSRERTQRRLLFLGRIHPVKGLDDLLKAWAKVAAAHPDWSLEIVGEGEPSYVASMKQLARSLKVERVHFMGPVYGDAKWKKYAEADLFVLPSHSENFGVAVAEALSAGCPAIVTHGAPWQALEEKHCGWWIPGGVDSLTATLDRVLALPRDELAAAGQKGRDWMQQDYSWPHVAAQLAAAYEWALGRAERPPCIVE